MRVIGTRYIGVLAVFAFWQAVYAQPSPASRSLTLHEAVALALKQAPEHRAAGLDADSARESERLTRSELLPALSFSETAIRGNDPIFVFGERMRQQRFSQPDFALNQLNRPSPFGNFATRFSSDWTAFDSWKTEFAIRRAAGETKSAQSTATRVDQEIVHRVVACYENVLAADKRLEVAQHQVETAQALFDASKSRVAAGVAVDSDQLSAAANLSARRQDLIAAQGEVSVEWAELERAEGEPIADQQRQAPQLAPADFQVPALKDAIQTALQARPDRQSLEQQLEASHAGVLEARSSFAPTLRAFGDWETDRGSFAGSGGNNWTAGAELRIDLFPAGKRQQLALAHISEERARITKESGDDQIRLEVTRAWYEQQAAARMVEVAQASMSETEESLRILNNRYNAGLATMTDLLRGQDAQRQTAADYWTAVVRDAIAWCDLQYAMGTLTADNLGELE